MKVVKNNCYGGFSLSALATKKIAEKKGKECYFFTSDFRDDRYIPVTLQQAEKSFLWFAYSVPNPDEYRLTEPDADGLYKSANARADEISLDNRPHERHDPDLVAVVEELGEKANGRHAKLVVVEIPDGIEYEVEVDDGLETIREKHRSW